MPEAHGGVDVFGLGHEGVEPRGGRDDHGNVVIQHARDRLVEEAKGEGVEAHVDVRQDEEIEIDLDADVAHAQIVQRREVLLGEVVLSVLGQIVLLHQRNQWLRLTPRVRRAKRASGTVWAYAMGCMKADEQGQDQITVEEPDLPAYKRGMMIPQFPMNRSKAPPAAGRTRFPTKPISSILKGWEEETDSSFFNRLAVTSKTDDHDSLDGRPLYRALVRRGMHAASHLVRGGWRANVSAAWAGRGWVLERPGEKGIAALFPWRFKKERR